MISRMARCCSLIGLLLAAPTLAAANADTEAGHLRCSMCEQWNQPQAPFNVFGNTWYVGTRELSAILVTSPDGHVLLDGALPQSAPQIQANIEALGFRIKDVRLILNSHEHFDHAGGIAALQGASGARVAAGPAAARVLQAGTVGPDDPQYDPSDPVHQPKVAKVDAVGDGETVSVGKLVIIAHATPGHTPGSTTWSWTSCEGDTCRAVVYADSLTPVSLGKFRYTGGHGAPDISQLFAASIAKVAALPCDIVLSTHPGFTDTMARHAARTPTNNPFVDPQGCKNYAAGGAERLKARLREEATSAGRQ